MAWPLYHVAAKSQEWGYAVEATGNFRDGLMHAQTDRFSLHLIDVVLPDGDGIELCRRIRIFDLLTPIVIYSNNEELETDAIKAGAHSFVWKGGDLNDRLKREISLLIGSQVERPDVVPAPSPIYD
ncbi:MAG TPA: response regulator [Acidobacteriota bacterium]|nr:response regulator [Acidobacteriota bacterium]